MTKSFSFSIVIPCFNEEQNIAPLYEALLKALPGFQDFEIIFIDDGSKDATLDVITRLRSGDDRVKFISFSRNFGHQFAIKAGIDHASGDCVITMDADLQHPPEVIPELIQKWREGNKIVHTKRRNNKKYPFLKRVTTNAFYTATSWVSDVRIEEGLADFRLIDRDIVNLLRPVDDNFLFLRGLLPWLGFPNAVVHFDINARYAGATKYTFRKMMGLAINGITSFSIKPLRVSTFTGLTISFLAFLYALYAIYAKFFRNDVVEGWTSVLVAVLFIGGIQLIMIGIIGEYLGKLFMQNKGRPQYIIREKNL